MTMLKPPPGLAGIDARRVLAAIDGAIGAAVVSASGQMVSTAGTIDAAAVRAECAPYLASLNAISTPLGLGTPRGWATGGVWAGSAGTTISRTGSTGFAGGLSGAFTGGTGKSN